MYLHDTSTAGHLVCLETYDRARRFYPWSKFYSFAYKNVTSCEACQRRKHQISTPADLLQSLSPPDHGLELLEIDLFGLLPHSTLNNCYFVVDTDHLTRSVVTTLSPIGSSAEIANFFTHEILLRYSAPRVFLSYRGRLFRKSFRRFYTLALWRMH